MAKCLAFATLAVLVLVQFAAAEPLIPAGALGKMRSHFKRHHANVMRRSFGAKQAGNQSAAPNPMCLNASIFTEVEHACGDWGAVAGTLFEFSGNESTVAPVRRFCNASCQVKFNEMAQWMDTCYGDGFGDLMGVLSSACTEYDGEICALRLRVLGRMDCDDQTTSTSCTANNRLCRWNTKAKRCDAWTNNAALTQLCTPCFEQFLLLISEFATAPTADVPEEHNAAPARRQSANGTKAPAKTKAADPKKVSESQNQQDSMLALQDLLCSREDDIGFCLPILQGIDEDIYVLDPKSANESTIAEIVNGTNLVCAENSEKCLNRQKLALRRIIQIDADTSFYKCIEEQFQDAVWQAWTFNFSEWQKVHANSTYNGTHVFWKISPNPYSETPEQGIWYNGTHVIIDVRRAFGPARPQQNRRQSLEEIERHLDLSRCTVSWEDTMQSVADGEAMADFACTSNEKNQSCLVVAHQLIKNECFMSCSATCAPWFQDFVLNQGCCIGQLHAVITTADFDHDAAPLLEGNFSKANVTLKSEKIPVWDNHPLKEWVDTCTAASTTFNYTGVKAQLLHQCPQPTVVPERTFPLVGLRWDELLANPKLKKAIESALKADIARSLGIPAADLENATFVIDESQTLSSVKTTNRQGTATTKGAKFQFKTSGKDNAGAAKNAANFDKAASSGKLSVSGTAGVLTKKCKTCMGGQPGAPPPTGNLFAALLGKSVSGATTRAANATTRPANSTTRAPGATTVAPGGGSSNSHASGVTAFAAVVVAVLAAFVY